MDLDAAYSAILSEADNSARCIGNALALARYSGGPERKIPCAVVATVVEGLHATIHLLRGPCQGHAPTIVRSMLESYADMRALNVAPDYWKSMLLRTHSQHVRLARAREKQAIAAGHPPDVDIDLKLKPIEEQMTTLRAQGAQIQSIAGRFEAGEFKDAYDVEYAEFSSFAHGDVKALTSRHFQTEGTITIGAKLPLKYFAKTIVLAITAAHDSATVLSKFSDVDGGAFDAALAPVQQHVEKITLLSSVKQCAS